MAAKKKLSPEEKAERKHVRDVNDLVNWLGKRSKYDGKEAIFQAAMSMIVIAFKCNLNPEDLIRFFELTVRRHTGEIEEAEVFVASTTAGTLFPSRGGDA